MGEGLIYLGSDSADSRGAADFVRAEFGPKSSHFMN